MKRAFTLIELLVVIAIIALIAAILFPVFASAREKAREATCESNLKQMGAAMLQYVQDYDEMLPDRYYGVTQGSTTTITTWHALINPYIALHNNANPGFHGQIQGVQLQQCPSNPVNTGQVQATSNGTTTTDLYPQTISYAVNETTDNSQSSPAVPALFGASYVNGSLESTTSLLVSQIPSPSSVIAVCESTTEFPQFCVDGGCSGASAYAQPVAAAPYSTGNLFAGHNDMSNFLFLDGHVKAMKPMATINERDSHSCAQGSTLQTNLWTYDNSNFTNWGGTAPCSTAGGTTYSDAVAILGYSQTYWQR